MIFTGFHNSGYDIFHLSNIFAREKFRQKSLISSVALGIISGFGKNSYELAFDFLANSLKDN